MQGFALGFLRLNKGMKRPSNTKTRQACNNHVVLEYGQELVDWPDLDC